MRKLRDRLPPANSLVVFEAVARHMSFTRAAQELRVGQAAVSRQIRLLEDYLGTALFLRRHRAIELTPSGEHFFKAVAMGLHYIANVTDEIGHSRKSRDVTISSSVTFASYWLMSRIAKYRAQFAEADIRLVASARVRDITASDVDLAVRYGHGQWPDASAHHLFDNEVFPVCAPSYLEREGPIREVSDLGGATLLHLDQFDRNWVTWESWLKSFEFQSPLKGRSLSFDNYLLLIHAAVRGEGVALCGQRLAEDLIREGTLVRPLTVSVGSKHAFYLVHSAASHLRPEARRLRDWLLDESRGNRERPSTRLGQGSETQVTRSTGI